jgi:hypothetical protein
MIGTQRKEIAMTAVGRSLHIGVNEIDPGHYANYTGKLAGCENDAQFMREVATFYKYGPITVLHGPKATAKAVLDEIETAAVALPAGSIFLLTFAGHGGQIRNADPREPELYDQTWALYDRQLSDDELYARWPLFNPGVRIVVVVDACHSGTPLTRLFATAEELELPPYQVRSIPLDFAIATYRRNRDLYDSINRGLFRPKTSDIQASVISITACEDEEDAADGDPNGRFTDSLKKVWNLGRFPGSHEGLWSRVYGKVSTVANDQHPAWDYAGTLDIDFWHAPVFKI